MYRSIYDTIVSYYFHNSKHHNRYKKDIKSFIREPFIGVMKWINYMNSWSNYLISNECIILTYEKLYSEPVLLMENIINYINLPYQENSLKDALNESSFANMQKIEIKSGIVDHEYDRHNMDSRRMRKGKIGNYIEHLDQEDIQYIDRICALKLNNNAKNILANNATEVNNNN